MILRGGSYPTGPKGRKNLTILTNWLFETPGISKLSQIRRRKNSADYCSRHTETEALSSAAACI